MINEQTQHTNTTQPQVPAPAHKQEPKSAWMTPLQEQLAREAAPRRSIFLPEEHLIVNTSLRRAADVSFAIQTELYKKAKDNYFAYYRLDESVPDTTHRIWKTPFRAGANAAVNLWQAGERVMGGSMGAIMDWYEFGARGREASRKYRQKLAELEKGARTVIGAQTLDKRREQLTAEYLKEMEQIDADYEENRKLGRNALLIMNENHQHFRELAGIEKNEKDGFIYDLFNAGGSLAFAIGLTVLTGSPAAAAVAFGATAGQQDYEEALQNGIAPDRALLAGIGGGIFEGGIEFLGMEMLFKGLTRSGVLGRIAASALSEGSEEAAQQIAEEMIMQNFGGRQQEFEDTLKGIGYSFVLGALTTVPVAVLMNRASTQLQEKGIDKETADKMAMNMAKATAQPENVEGMHTVLSNATSPLVYREGDVIKGAQDFKQAIDKARNPDRETRREIYNVAEREEEAARQQGLDENTAQMVGQVAQTRANLVYNEANIKPGEQFRLTQVRFENAQRQAQAGQDMADTREQWKREYEAYQARKAAESAAANEQFDTALREAGLPDDFDFTLAQEAYDETGKADTNTEAFKQFFKNSKVVDAQGQPQVVYHGTQNDFSAFKDTGMSRQIGARLGFFFTDSEEMGDKYADGGKVMPVYLSMQNPLIIEPNTVLKMFGENLDIGDPFNFLTQMDTRQSEQELKEALKKQGYDGIILRSTSVDTSFGEGIHDVYIAFNPEQIKSVYNRGTFDLMDANIYHQPIIDGLDIKQQVHVVDLTQTPAKDKKSLVSFVRSLIGKKEKTADGAILKFVHKVRQVGKKNQKTPEHLVFSSFYKAGETETHDKAVKSILDLIRNSVLVEEFKNKKTDKKDYDKSYRFYVPVKTEKGIFAVRLVALHNKHTKGMDIKGDIYDVIVEKEPIPQRQLNDTKRDRLTISIEEMLQNVKDVYGKPYVLAQEQPQPLNKNNLQTEQNKSAPTNIPGEPGHKGLIYSLGDLERFVKRKIAKYNRGTLDPNNANIFYQESPLQSQLTEQDAPVATVNSADYGFTGTLKEVKSKATKWYQKNLQGDKAQNPELGEVKFTRAGINEVSGNKFYPRKALFLPAIKNVIEKGRVIGSREEPNHASGIVRFHFVQGKVVLDGQETVVQIDVAEDENGNKFYYLSEIENAGGLTHDQNAGPSGKYANGLTRVHNTGPVSTNSIANETDFVKPELDGDTLFQPGYHGSAKKFTSFDLQYVGTGEGAQAHGYGMYIAGTRDTAEGYRAKLAAYKNGGYNPGYGRKIQVGNKTYTKVSTNTYHDEHGQNIDDALNIAFSVFELNRNKEVVMRVLERQIKSLTDIQYWDYAKAHRQALEFVKNNDFKVVHEPLEIGQVYEVEIPENDILLDEQKTFSEQPEPVQKALEKIAKDFGVQVKGKVQAGVHFYDITGKYVYNKLAGVLGSQKAASQTMLAYGIEGIAYDGWQDGRCYVIFDDKAVRIVDTFYQDIAPMARGSVTFDRQANVAVIRAFENADPSTVVHEVAHVLEHDMLRAEELSHEESFLQTMQELRGIYADSAEWALNWIKTTNVFSLATRTYMLNEIQKRGGLDYVTQFAKTGNLNNPTQDVEIALKHAFSERFATQFEAYLKNGKAPNETYKGLFEKFAQWLREIYQTVQETMKLDPKVQAFFDKIMVRQARRVDSKLFTGKVDALREQVRNIQQGSPKGDFSLEQIKELLNVLDAPAPRKPRTHLLADLRRYGAEYANAGRVDAEAFKNARVPNRKGGIGDDPYRWLVDRGYMAGQDDSTALTYEDMDRLNKQAYDMIERAMDGEIIYPLGQEERAAEYENYRKAMDVIREVWGEPRQARKTLRAILDLEEKGYRVVEKKDLTALSLRLGELNRLADRLDNKSQTVQQKEAAEKATLAAAQKIKRRVVDELNKREIEGKAEIVKNLQNAKTFDAIQTATAEALNFLEDAYDKTEAGQEERRRTDLPNTNWDSVRAQLLRAYTDSVGQVDERVREAWKTRTAITTGSTSLYGWDAAEVQRRRQQSEKVLAEAEPKLEAALMRATSKVLFNIGGLESDQIRRMLSAYGKSATRQRALYKGNIDSLVRRAQEMQEDNYKQYMNKKIHEILNLNLFDKRGNLRKAMVDPATLAALQELKRVANLGPQSAMDELNVRMERFAQDNATVSPTDKIVNEMLSLQAHDRKDISVQLYKQAYDDIHALRKAGRSARNLQKMIMDFQTEQGKSDLLAAIKKNKEAGVLKRTYASWLANWESMLDLIADRDIKEKYSMLNLEADTLTHSWQRRREIMDGVKRIYNLGSNREVQNKMDELRKEKHTFTNYALVDKNTDPYVFVRKTGEAFPEELSKLQIITAYIYYKNDGLADRLTQQYGNEQLGQMWDVLDKQDRTLADFLQKEAEKSYAQINEVFVKERGYDLPRVQNYFPSVTERVETELDFLHASAVMSKNPTFTKMRASSPFIQMKLQNPFGILFRHIDRAADYHFKAEKLNEIRRTFKSPAVKPAIIANVGEDVYKRMLELIDQFSVQKQTLKYDIDKLGDWLTNNYVKGAIALKPTIAIKQLISSINYAEQMPTGPWITGFAQAIMHPKETVRFMLEGDPYLKARFESGSMNEALARATADANAITARGKFLRFTDLMTINTRLGDIGAIIFGGKPYVDYLMKEKGMSKKEAFDEFRKSTLRSQQANTRSSLSTLQARDMNFLVRGLFAFKNTPAQYARKIADAISQYQRGEIDKKQLAKVVAIYGLLNSWMYSMLTTLGVVAWYYDDDDADEMLTDELFFSPFTQMASALPILDMAVGQAANVAKAEIFDHRMRLERPELPVVSEIFKMGSKALKEDVTGEDVLDMLITGGQIFGGLPTQYAKGIYTGAADTLSGENPMRGFLQALGYTENRAKIATNTKE